MIPPTVKPSSEWPLKSEGEGLIKVLKTKEGKGKGAGGTEYFIFPKAEQICNDPISITPQPVVVVSHRTSLGVALLSWKEQSRADVRERHTHRYRERERERKIIIMGPEAQHQDDKPGSGAVRVSSSHPVVVFPPSHKWKKKRAAN